MNDNFNLMKKIKNKKGTTEKAKEAKLEPIIEALKEGKMFILDMLMRKNQKINWYDKLPQDHQFYKHFINLQSVKSVD